MSELAIVLRITALALIMLLGLVATVVTVVLAVWHGAGLRPRARRRRDDVCENAFGDFPLIDGSLGWTPGQRRVVSSDFGSAGFTCPADAAAMPIAAADAGGDGASHPLGQTPPASIILPNDCFVWPAGLFRRIRLRPKAGFGGQEGSSQ
jgi:hypothetical protein